MPQIQRKVREFITTRADIHNIRDIAEAITEGAPAELIAEVTPPVGVLNSGRIVPVRV